MAEIQSASAPGRKGGFLRKRKKLSTRVDLTPMVDLGFLLITFFIITTTWSESKAMKFYLPKGEIKDTKVPVSTVLTIIPISDDKVFYYHGDIGNAINNSEYGVTGFSILNGIGEVIRGKQLALNKMTRFSSADLMLIIKPSEVCTYKNVVDAMDEVLINNVSHYSIVDLEPIEKEIMERLSIN